jgi:solute carrier family 25 iron transporter 28/37
VFLKTLKILYRDEGIARFWRGSQIIASGCIPAHAAYFSFYEYLKIKMSVKHEDYQFLSTLSIGAMSTMIHDFFITPADGKIYICLFYSHQIAHATLQEPDLPKGPQGYNS